MKKRIITLAIIFAFIVVSSSVIALSGFDGKNRMLKNETTTYTEMTTEQKLIVEEGLANIANNKNKHDIVYDVLLYQPKDCNGFFADTNYKSVNDFKIKSLNENKLNRLYRLFNDTTPDNDVFSVHEYYNLMSFGEVNLFANFYLYQSGEDLNTFNTVTSRSPAMEQATYMLGMSASKPLNVEYGKGNAGLIMFATNYVPNDTNSRLWAHAYTGFQFLSLTYGSADVDTLCHEIMHNFGIPDYYTYNKNEPAPVEDWDLMSNSYDAPNTLMYTKYMANWVKVSNYEDDEVTEIETITNDGTYTLVPTTTMDRDKIKAYKFGIKKGDNNVYFMIEYRKAYNIVDSKRRSYGEGLVVYRCNENKKYQGNLDLPYKDYEVFVWSPNDLGAKSSSCLRNGNEGISFINKARSLYYDDKSIAEIIIDNIQITEDSATFTFKDLTNKENIIAGKVYDNSGYGLADAEIYINGYLRATTNYNGGFLVENVTPNDIISIVDVNNTCTFNTKNVGNDRMISFYPYKNLSVNIRVIGDDNDTCSLYKKENGQYIFVRDLKVNSIETVTCQTDDEFKITGFDEDIIFIITNRTSITFNKSNYTREQNKSKKSKFDTFIDNTVDTFASIPGAIVDFGEAVYDGLVGAGEAIYNGAKSIWEGITGLF